MPLTMKTKSRGRKSSENEIFSEKSPELGWFEGRKFYEGRKIPLHHCQRIIIWPLEGKSYSILTPSSPWIYQAPIWIITKSYSSLKQNMKQQNASSYFWWKLLFVEIYLHDICAKKRNFSMLTFLALLVLDNMN